MSKKVLILCHDVVGKKMAGPGIRYQNIATQMKTVAEVTLGVFSDHEDDSPQSGIVTVPKSGDNYKDIFDRHDIIFAQWLSGEMLQYAKGSAKILIFDFYAPVPIEYLASHEFSSSPATPERDLEFSGILETYSQYLAAGDYFTCSNERQRDFWIGYVTSNGLLKPSNFGNLNLLDRFGLCPMGISSAPPSKKGLKLRSSLGLKANDFVLLWTGGIWDWFDAQVVIRAVAKLNDPHIKLVFLGTKHPNSIYKDEMSESVAARKLAAELKLVGKSVFFMDGWVPYDERASYFLDADVAIYADKESLETRFSHRTRVLDHIWTELPTICSSGDYMAEIIERYGFGLTVANRKDSEFAKVIEKLSKDKKLMTEIKQNIKTHKNLFTWESTLSPLIEFVDQTQPKLKKRPSSTDNKASAPKLRLRGRVKKAAKVLIKGH